MSPRSSHCQSLTPRTPYSRAGRAEDASINIAQEDYNQQQEPLLASSASASFPHRRVHAHAQEKDKSLELSRELVLSTIPLVVGLAAALFLLFLLLMSVEKPETLHSYIGAEQMIDEAQGPTPTIVESVPTHTAMTLSYASYTAFPLDPREYRAECAKVQASMKGPMGSYWSVPLGGGMDVMHPDESTDGKICTSSITYMLDGYVGLAADLALIAQAAGLAREQNRTLFVDDKYWNRGKWTDHFQDVRVLQPGPEPACLPPPPEELVACPRTARHWVVNSRTALFHFGHHFMDEFENPYARELRRLKPIFTRAAHSLAHTIRPNAQSAALVQAARRELTANGPHVAVHVRRGDRAAESWAFHGGYVPSGDYARAVLETWARLAPSSATNPDAALRPPTVYLATDDPSARADFEALLAEDAPAARVFSLAHSENAALRALSSAAAYVQREFDALGEAERVRATRGALVDLALVSGLWAWDVEDEGETRPEAVVCTISSNFCKLAAIGLGWERAFGFLPGDRDDKEQMDADDTRKRWIEIDNAGVIVPVWRAFELF